MSVEVFGPREQDQQLGTTLADMRRQIARMSNFQNQSLSDPCRSLLKATSEQLGLDAGAVQQIVRIARTIANLENSEQITPTHLCEAINYRCFGH